jgi:hypothetical protein
MELILIMGGVLLAIVVVAGIGFAIFETTHLDD